MLFASIVVYTIGLALFFLYSYKCLRKNVYKEMTNEMNKFYGEAEDKARIKVKKDIATALVLIEDLEKSLKQKTEYANNLHFHLLSTTAKCVDLEHENTQLKSALHSALNGKFQQQTVQSSDLLDQFTPQELKALRMFIHPDKHGGNQKANDLFVKINSFIK